MPDKDKISELKDLLYALIYYKEAFTSGTTEEKAVEEVLAKITQLLLEERKDAFVYALHHVAHMSRKDAHTTILNEIAELEAALKENKGE